MCWLFFFLSFFLFFTLFYNFCSFNIKCFNTNAPQLKMFFKKTFFKILEQKKIYRALKLLENIRQPWWTCLSNKTYCINTTHLFSILYKPEVWLNYCHFSVHYSAIRSGYYLAFPIIQPQRQHLHFHSSNFGLVLISMWFRNTVNAITIHVWIWWLKYLMLNSVFLL